MNKKRYLLLIGCVILITGVSFTVWFTSKINIYGGLTIHITEKSSIPGDTAFISAHTPTGREVVIPFEKNEATIIGFYKDISLIKSCVPDIEKISIDHHGYQKIYTLDNQCLDGRKIFIIPSEVIGNTGFFKKLSALFNWFLSVRIIQEILMVVVFLVLVFVTWQLFKIIKKKAKNRQNDEKRSLFNRVIVVLSGFAFWLLIIAVVLEISLRVFGLLYSSKQAVVRDEGRDSTFTVLCLGDSFTYGVGAHSDKSYPKQLEALISTKEKIPVRVINAGICAGNTTQMLGNTQELLEQYHPDVVIMLFGMANSWNYYGFSKTDDFLYRIRTYKLFKRLIQNFHYKKYGLEIQERVNNFTNQRLAEAWHSVIKNDKFAIRYNMGRYYLAAREWKAAINEFSYASELQQSNDSVRNGLWTCLDRLDAVYYFNSGQKKLVQNTLVPETMYLLDSLISKHRQSIDLRIVKYRYLLTKGDTSTTQNYIIDYCKKHDAPDVFFYDLFLTVQPNQRIAFFKQNSDLFQNKAGFLAILGFALLKENNLEEARQYIDSAFRIDPKNPLYQAGTDICSIIFSKKNDINPQITTSNKLLRSLICAIAEKVYDVNYSEPDSALTNKERMFYNMFLSRLGEIHTNKDSLFASYVSLAIFKHLEFSEEIHDDFFLGHRKKRTMTLNDREVFDWIERDINTITDICSKQGYKVVCMNYPITPPPNSDEISFWAAHVGDIWEKTAKTKAVPFIDQDSIFSLYGDNKGTLFEPAFTGSEHCNEKGYELMALNVYFCIKQNGFFGKK